MRKSLLFILVIASYFSFAGKHASDSTRQRELGLTTTGLGSFGATYRFGKESSMWRINLLNVSGSDLQVQFDTIQRTASSFDASLSFGKEFRKKITDDLEFRFGADLYLGYSTDTYNTENSGVIRDVKSKYIIPGAQLVLGVNYQITDRLIFGAELTPYYRLSIASRENGNQTTESTSHDYGISNNPVLLSVAYRF